MINENFLKDSENISSIRNHKLLLSSEQKGVPKLKANALGDVQNTLHSRPTSFVNPNNSSVKSAIHSKISAFSKYITDENFSLSNVSNPRKNVNATSDLIHHDSNEMDSSDGFETHNHILCEQAEQSCANDFLLQYKFQPNEIETLTKSVKRYKLEMPELQYPSIVPCTDIEIPNEKEYEGKKLCINDFLNEFELPDIPPPIEVL